MTAKLLSEEQDRFLRTIAGGRSVQECTDMINQHFGTSFTTSQIKGYKSNHKISSGKQPWEFAHKSHKKLTTPEQEQWLAENYCGIGNKELAERFNEQFGTCFTAGQIKCYKNRHKLDSGLDGRFKSGHIPKNKGLKGVCAKGCEKGWFKKDGFPKNTDPIGTEKVGSDGYVWVKVDNQPKVPKQINWQYKHRIIWEEAYGPIPEGHKLVFLDGDRTHIALDNLALVSRAEGLIMAKRNLYHNDKSLTQTGVAMAKVIDKIHKKTKG